MDEAKIEIVERLGIEADNQPLDSTAAAAMYEAQLTIQSLVKALEEMTTWIDEQYVVDTCRHETDPDCWSCQAIAHIDKAKSVLSKLRGST